jgi:hypothetical protein
MTAPWGVPHPAAVDGDELARLTAVQGIEDRIQIVDGPPVQSLDRLKLQKRFDEIGRTSLTEPDAGASR